MKYYILIVLIVIILFICLKKTYKERFVEEFKDRTLIISRYNEKLEWLENEPFSNYPYIVCNKGSDSSYLKTENFKKEIKMDNIGKLAHTYLNYIIKDYNKLSKINIFLPNSLDAPDKYYRARALLNEINDKNKIDNNKTDNKNISFFLYDYAFPNMKDAFDDFKIDEKLGMPDTDPSKKIDLSNVRPFGNWYERFFGDIKTKHYCMHGIFSVSKEDIQIKPITYYQQLIKEVEIPNPEQEYYFQRAWEAVFYPLKTTQFFKYEI